MKTMTEQFLAARRAGAPLILIKSPDHDITIKSIRAALKKKGATEDKEDPLFLWDCVRGWVGITKSAQEFLATMGSPEDVKNQTTNATSSVELAVGLPGKTAGSSTGGSILFLANAQQGFDNPNFLQAIWNLRDEFKRNNRQLVLLGSGVVTLPPEINYDCLILDEPLPTPEQLSKIVKGCFDGAGALEDLTPEMETKAIDALSGLAAFPAEQATAMSLRKQGKKIVVDVDDLWDRKRTIIESTPGLSVWRGGETFDQVRGYENVKGYMKRIIGGRRAPLGVVFIDEIEKAFAGATEGSSDSSGVSQGFLGTILSYMQDNAATGCIFIGPPGSGKSMVAKATGNTAGIPTISFDLSGMKASLVGESEARLRAALKVVTAVTQGKCLFIATCNRISSLPPELRRRFTLGTFFFPLPSVEERKEIWAEYLVKFGLDEKLSLPRDNDWTGAEIKQCCDIADRMGSNLEDAAQFIVPVARSAAKQIATLQEEANGKFISASYPGFYSSKPAAEQIRSDRPRGRSA